MNVAMVPIHTAVGIFLVIGIFGNDGHRNSVDVYVVRDSET